jgi:AraC-like DNA-binding protein
MRKYFRHKIENLITIKNILTIEYLNLKKDFSYPTEKHNFWELVYVDRESLFCVTEEQEIELREGEILFHRPLEAHSIHSNNKTTATVFIICFESSSPAMNAFTHLKKPLNKRNKNLLSLIIQEMKNTFQYPFERKLVVKKNPVIGGQEVIRIYLELLLISILRELEETGKTVVFLPHNDYKNQLAELIVNYMKDSIHDNFKIADLCRKFNYGKSYLSKIFKETYGKPIIEYYNCLKIEEAKMLFAGGLSVTQVSDKLSFSDPHYFTYLFKKIVGITPSKFIKSIENL